MADTSSQGLFTKVPYHDIMFLLFLTKEFVLTKKATAKERALASKDPNRVLLVFFRPAATALYHNSLNAETASKLSDVQLLLLPRVGRSTISSLRRAVELCNV